MFLEPVRILADWLDGHATYGVNELLPGIPRDAAYSEPPAVTVLTEVGDPRTAVGRRADPLTGPTIRVIADVVEDLSPLITEPVKDVQVRFAIRYDAENLDADAGRRDAYLTMRAVVKSLRALCLYGTELERTHGEMTMVNLEQLGGSPGNWDVDTKQGFALVAGSMMIADRSL